MISTLKLFRTPRLSGGVLRIQKIKRKESALMFCLFGIAPVVLISAQEVGKALGR